MAQEYDKKLDTFLMSTCDKIKMLEYQGCTCDKLEIYEVLWQVLHNMYRYDDMRQAVVVDKHFSNCLLSTVSVIEWKLKQTHYDTSDLFRSVTLR